MGGAITNCAVLVLAAGKSSRLGSPKQLLEYQGESLVSRAARTAVDSAIGRVYVVLGANAEKIMSELNVPELRLVQNREWEEGMASSIRAGLAAAVNDDAGTDGVMILVCDQPYLDAGVLKKLATEQATSGLAAVASKYKDRAGTPAIFRGSLFPRLMELKGDTGARKLISELGDAIGMLPFENGMVDIDTMEDYQKLIANK